jgi:hypothetical protein
MNLTHEVEASPLKRILPEEMYTRHWMIHALKELGAERIVTTHPKLVLFYEEDGTYEFDWDTILFETSTQELFSLTQTYMPMLKKINKWQEEKLVKEKQAEREGAIAPKKSINLILPNDKIIK